MTDSLSTVGGGLAAADAECMSNAQNAGLSGVFLALMATSTASPASRFSTAGAPWVPLDGIRWPPPLRIEHPLGSMTPRIKEWL